MTTEPSKNDHDLSLKIKTLEQIPPFWDKIEGEIVLSSSVRLLRNLNHFPFTPKLNSQSRKKLMSFISRALLSHPLLDHPSLVQGDQLIGDDKELLLERFLFLEGVNQISGGEAFVFDQTGRFLAIINLIEHLQLQLVGPNETIDTLASKLIEIESTLGNQLDFAYNQRFGFLTADPKRCGTAMIATMLLHLPALVETEAIDETLLSLGEHEIRIKGITEESFVADLIILENRTTIGLSEEKIIALLQSMASRLQIAEMSQRKRLQEGYKQDIVIDKVARAFGLANHGYMLDTREAMQTLSRLKLGHIMGWIKGLDVPLLHRSLFSIQRSHLRHLKGPDITQGSLEHMRALVVHDIIKSCELLI